MDLFRRRPQPKSDNPFDFSEESETGLQYLAPRVANVVVVQGLSDEDKRAAANAHGASLRHMPLSDNVKMF